MGPSCLGALVFKPMWCLPTPSEHYHEAQRRDVNNVTKPDGLKNSLYQLFEKKLFTKSGSVSSSSQIMSRTGDLDSEWGLYISLNTSFLNCENKKKGLIIPASDYYNWMRFNAYENCIWNGKQSILTQQICRQLSYCVASIAQVLKRLQVSVSSALKL